MEKSNLTNFDQVCGEKYLHLECQTYIIRIIIRRSFIIHIFGIVDINSFLHKLGQSLSFQKIYMHYIKEWREY